MYLYSNWIDVITNFKASFFKHHYWCIIDTGACKITELHTHQGRYWWSTKQCNIYYRPLVNILHVIKLKREVNALDFIICFHIPSGKIKIGNLFLSSTCSLNLKKNRWDTVPTYINSMKTKHFPMYDFLLSFAIFGFLSIWLNFVWTLLHMISTNQIVYFKCSAVFFFKMIKVVLPTFSRIKVTIDWSI